MEKHFHLALCVITTLASLIYTQDSLECPPDTGIYLMLKNECISNGTWFRDTNLEIAKGQDGYIHCVLLNETLNGGQWVRPNGQPVDCINGAIEESGPYKEDPFFCTDDSPNANITLYLENDGYFQPTAGGNIGIETEYKCCLPTNCSDPNTNIMTINVFDRVYIIDVYVDPPSDITAIPQYYTVHCIVTGSLNDVTTVIKQYYVDPTVDDTSDDTELSQSYCSNTYTGYSCTVTNTSIITTYNTYDDTRDYTVTVEWEGESISISAFRQSSNNGDHVHLCTAASGAIEPKHKGRSILMTVRAPSSSPTNVSIIDVTLTSISIQWSYPDISDDVDGYVINASSLNDDYVTQQVTTSSINVTSTLNGLLPGTTYNITVRAYQDILGPPNDEVSDTTLDASSPVISWSYNTSITDLLNTEYYIQCDTTSSNVNPSLIYWTIDGVTLPNTSFTLYGSNYTSSLVQYLNNELGQSVNITCSIEGVINTTEVLKAPPMSPQNVSVTQPSPYEPNISISWSPLPSSDGFILTISPNHTVYWYNNSTTQAAITGLTPNVQYTITVYAYNDLISAGVSKNITIVIQPLPSIDTIPSTTITVTSTKTHIPPSSVSSFSTSTSITLVDTSTSSTGGSSSLPIVVGVVGCLVVLIIIILIVVIVAVLFASKGRQNKRSNKPHTVAQDDPLYDEIDAHSTKDTRNSPNEDIPMQPCEPYSLHRPTPIKLADTIEMQACQAYSSHMFPN